MEIGDILIAVGVGVVLGIGAVGIYIWSLYQRLRTEIDQLVDHVVQQAEADLVGLDIEVDQGVYFCYNNTDKQFICRGTTAAEIKESFRLRFPNKTAYLAGGDPEVIAKFKAELSTIGLDETSISQ
jgi:hypothetical protein